MIIRKIVLIAGVSLAFVRPALALNYHELEVYPYRTAQKGELELEYGGVYTDRGTRDADSSDNNENRLRNSLELTYGLTDKTEITAYADYDRLPGGGGEFEGKRFHVRTRFFEKGELPVDLGAYVELELPKHDEDIQELEFRGIVEKDFGKWTFDFNPILEKVVRGESVSEGWEFKYAAAAIYRLNETFHPRLEFFGDLGPIQHRDPTDEQQHLVSPGVDIRLGHGFNLFAGVAFGLTDASEQRLYRLRIEREFY